MEESFEELFIDSSDALRNLLDRFRATPEAPFGVDLEADSLHSYREKLCLIQVVCGRVLALVDPLKVDDAALQEFMDFLETREIWMHGADFDMTLFQRTFDRIPPRIHDTQSAARLVGHEKFGLANLIEEHFDVKLSKSSQKADWGARPIKDKLIRYAYDDVRYLLPLAERLKNRLNELERWDWFQEWCDFSRNLVLSRKDRPQDEIWRIQGWGKLSRKELAYLKAFWYWRDEESRGRDCPPFRVMNNQDLLKLAERAGQGEEIRGAKGLRSSAAKRLRTVIQTVKRMDSSEWPKRKQKRGGPREEIDMEVFDRLKARRNQVARELGIEPTIIATRTVLEALAKESGQGRAPELLMNWQRRLLSLDDESPA